MGRLLGLLEAGVVLGYWSRRRAGGVSEAAVRTASLFGSVDGRGG
jgi:hypothetical protein